VCMYLKSLEFNSLQIGFIVLENILIGGGDSWSNGL
jgi:hypothetical protein